MKVYVAAKFEEKVRVRAVCDLLRENGHTVTHDWTHETEGGSEAEQARADLDGVLAADVVIVLAHHAGRGLWIEMGAALATGKKVIYVDSTVAIDSDGNKKVEYVHTIFQRLPGVTVRHEIWGAVLEVY